MIMSLIKSALAKKTRSFPIYDPKLGIAIPNKNGTPKAASHKEVKRGCLIKIAQKKKKSGCSLPKGIEHPLALLYN